MKTKELFSKDPLSWTLANEGVSSNNDADEATLRYELDTFVCDGEYESALEKILSGYLTRLGEGEQAGAWISGFYGSGKSHLVKVLRYLWTDYQFKDGSRAREICKLSPAIVESLKELSTRGKQYGGLHSAGGTLKAGTGDVRMRVLQIVFKSVGLPTKYSPAKFIMDLRPDGNFAKLDAILKGQGKDPLIEVDRLYTSKVLHEAYLELNPHLGTVADVGKALQAQYPAKFENIHVDEMIATIRRAIERNGKLPCTVLVLDEIQQYINNSPDVANEVQEVVEACQKQLDGMLTIVGTGQSALSDTPSLQRIMGRFPIKSHLKDNDVDKVVRTVVLQKDPKHKKTLQKMVDDCSGEITRQLNDTKIATLPEDQNDYAPDFPLLPVRRRFWKNVLHHTDTTGTTAQMRTQLRVTHEACRSVADRPVGTVVPADFIYDQLASDLLNSGELQKRFQEIIEEQRSKDQGELRRRICATVFLINKLPDTEDKLGIRADAAHLADLLTDSLIEGTDEVRKRVPLLLTALHEEGVLMEVDGEYRLQTTEGAAWEGEYRKLLAGIKNDETRIAAARSQFLSKEVSTVLSGITVNQGNANVPRKPQVHHGKDKPPAYDGPVVWIRDGFSESEGAIMKEVNGASTDEASVFVVIPKSQLEELKSAIAQSLAAEETLGAKGNPSTEPGRDARQAMMSRLSIANGRVDALIGKVIGGARVFLAGGAEQQAPGLRQAVEDAALQVVDRIFPKFSTADSDKWPSVWKRAKEGNGNALEALGHQGDPDKHPVAKEILLYIGAGKRGAEVVKHFTSGEYGWPKDAVDGTIATLMVSGHLHARGEDKPVGIGDIDQRNLGKVSLKTAHPVLTATQKLVVKKLFTAAGLKFAAGEDAPAASRFVVLLKVLAASAGGPAPAPEPPKPPLLTELEGLQGNDLLFRLFEESNTLTSNITAWKKTAQLVEKRRPVFQSAEQLLKHAMAAALPGMEKCQADLDAVRAHRCLLDDPDPVAPVLQAVSTALRNGLREGHASYEQVFKNQIATLDKDPLWSALAPDKRNALLSRQSVASHPAPQLGSEAEILASLQACDIVGWKTRTDALTARCAAALAEAIKESKPKARRVALPSATIETVTDLETWLGRVRETIEQALKDGPAII
jgi:hypothetical protein